MAKWNGVTDAELEILGVLWSEGPSTVRQVFESLPKDKKRGYTTTLKLMQLMLEKGLVLRDDRARAHMYRSARSAETMKRSLVSDIVTRVFEGSSRALALHALGTSFRERDLARIEALLNELEEKER